MNSVLIFRKLYEKSLIIISLIIAAVSLSLFYLLQLFQLPGFVSVPLTFLVQLFLPLSSLALIGLLLLRITDYFPHQAEAAKKFGVTPLPHYDPLARTRMPKQLKAQLSGNRSDEVIRADEFAANRARLLIISGERGIGKSTLAASIARRVDFWLNLEGKDVDLPYLIHQLAQWRGLEELRKSAINLGKISVHEINALADNLAAEKVRIFLNSFGTLLDTKGTFRDKEVEKLFQALLSREGEHKIILISSKIPQCLKSYIDDEAGINIHLEGLSPESGVELLQEKYSAADGNGWLAEISDAVEGNPLLLRIVPPVLKDDDAVEIIRTRAWKNDIDPSCLELEFFERAAGDALHLLQKTAFIPEPVTESFIVALAGDDEDAEAQIKELKENALLEWDGGMKKCFLHPLITATAFKSLKRDKNNFEKVREQVIEVCIRKAEDFKAPAKWTSVSDCRLYLHAIDLMLEIGRLEESMDLLLRIHPYVISWGNLRLLNSFYTRVIDLWKESNVKLSKEQQQLLIKVLLNLVDTELAGRGQAGAIYPAHALLLLSEAREDLEGQIAATALLSRLYLERGNTDEAVKYCRSYIKAVKESADSKALAEAYCQAGSIISKTDLAGHAEKMFIKAIKIFRELQSPAGEAKSLGLLANLYSGWGYHEEALELLQSRIDLLSTSGDDEVRLESIKALGEGQMLAGNTNHALAILDGVAKEAIEKQYWNTASECLKTMANYSLKQNDFTASILRGQKRLEIALKIKNREMEASARALMGIALAKSKEFGSSLESYLKAKELYLGLNMVKQACRCYYYIARLQGVADQWQEASASIVEAARLSLEDGVFLSEEVLKLLFLCRKRIGSELFDQEAKESLGEKVFESVLKRI